MMFSAGKHLAQSRITSRLTQSELSKVLDCTPQYLSLIESCKYPVPPRFVPVLRAVFSSVDWRQVLVADAAYGIAQEIDELLAQRLPTHKKKAVKRLKSIIELRLAGMSPAINQGEKQ